MKLMSTMGLSISQKFTVLGHDPLIRSPKKKEGDKRKIDMPLHWKFKTKPKSKKTDRQKLIAKLDTIFSEFIRLRDSDHQGICKCITCGEYKHWQSIDAGHFITRENMGTRWEEPNVNAQCQHCNRFKSGKQYQHGLAIDIKFGQGTADLMTAKGNAVCNWEDFEIETMYKYYKNAVRELKDEKGMI